MSQIFELSAQPVHLDNPEFIQLCADRGYPEVAAAVTAWNPDSQPGWFDDPKYRHVYWQVTS